jgi:fructose-1,6-bisphosphatase/inositol monophosphatase family enzyme
MKDRLQEIIESRGTLENLLREGTRRITELRDSGDIDARVKGFFKTGVTDDITRPDKDVGRFYHQKTKELFPYWKCFIEDCNEQPETFNEGDIGIFWDPLDGTKLLIEGLPGYSSMVGVAIYGQDGFRPVLGMFQMVDGELIWAYDSGEQFRHNIMNWKKPKAQEEWTLGRTPIERQGLLTPIAENLGYQVKYIRGMAPQTLALIRQETDLFIYEPGVGLSDVMPIIPIVQALGGEVCDLRGKDIRYTGNASGDQSIVFMRERGKIVLNHGFMALQEYVPKKKIIESISQVYSC